MAVQYFTPVQALAHRILTHAIRRALDQGETVPCQSNPAPWDDAQAQPSLCDGCPVIAQCSRYADTGAVEHGVIAGRKMPPRRRRSTRQTVASAKGVAA